jgi:uncharacterized protein
MIGPLVDTGVISADLDIAAAFIIGGLFGVAVEQGGFSSARRVTAFFYGRNMAVPRVMLTAIVTAAVGLLIASAFGLVDASRLTVNTTYLLPHLIGGLLVGTGMAVAGFCPGTALTSMAIGRLDGLAAIGGIFVGVSAFGVSMPVLQKLYFATRVGNVTLMDTLGISAGYLAAALTVGALLFFAALRLVEKRFGDYPAGDEPLLANRYAGAGRWLAGAAVVVGLMAGAAGYSYHPGVDSDRAMLGRDFQSYFAFMPDSGYGIAPTDLEEMINSGLAPHYLIDVRSLAELKSGGLPGAVHIAARQLRLPEQLAKLKQLKMSVVLYDKTGSVSFQLLPLLRANGIDTYALAGGLEAYAKRNATDAAGMPAAPGAPPAPPPSTAKPAGEKPGGAAFEDSGC